MNIEIYGALFKNKGAELMLRSICNRVEEEFEEGRGVVAFDVKNILNTKHQNILSRRFPALSNIDFFIPNFVRKTLKIVKNSELDYVLDASGFAYGDQWGIEPSTYFLEKIQDWKAMGCGVILLPQAFGPFSKKGIKDAVIQIHREVDHLFVRDKVSQAYLLEIIGNSNKITLAPDFTNLLKGTIPKSFKHIKGIAIIPNCRMLDKTENGERYLKLLKQSIQYLQKTGEQPFFLIHEGIDDENIALGINKRLKVTIPIYSDYNAIEIKGVIGQCKFIISSRYHGLVSALSQGIPCLGTGWSHKYTCLFIDYEYEKGIIQYENWGNIEMILKSSLEFSTYMSTKITISKKAEELKQESKRVWDQVFRVIKNNKRKTL